MRTFLESGEKFLDLIRVEELQKLSIRKINMWPYKNLTGNNTAKEVLLRKIFSSDLLEGISLSSSEDIAQIFWNKDFNNDKEGLQEKVSIKFGFISKNKNEATNNLPPNIIILDTTIERTDTEKNTVIDTLTQMNQTLFDAYHWCVNQNIIHLMEGKEA